ncbi:MAG TPA: CDP-alcohol phosphatidyltransferase family protein [Steroidobacteraceae bacterium]|nr:CDP-alcohol phosphatidyltransferase family protein [Steroidobacteraceae bacterium]
MEIISKSSLPAVGAPPRPWDARLGRRLVTPLKDTWVTPNHLTTVRLVVGLAGALAFTPGTWGWTNVAALLVILSNFLDHTDGELARISGKTSRIGHLYDLASDAVVTILLFCCIGIGVAASGARSIPFGLPAGLMGAVAGAAVALIFYLRMRIEELLGKAGTRQGSIAGFETEDVLYLLPLVTLFGVLPPFLMAAVVGAPLFALLVIADFVRVRRRPVATLPATRAVAEKNADPQLEAALQPNLSGLDEDALRRQYREQGSFLYVPGFLPAQFTARLVAAVDDVAAVVNRNYLPGHKQGGSVSRHRIDELAPFIAQLYRSPALLSWLSALTGDRLQLSPADDPHAYALYFYSRPGDHIGWHYDTSYYSGRRYTLLFGIVDRSTCRLDYELHTREPDRVPQSGSLQIPPGGLVFFDGDKLRHRITPIGAGEFRVSLTFEYLTSQHMSPWWRFVSNMKDAIAYFGFRQVFSRMFRGRAPTP